MRLHVVLRHAFAVGQVHLGLMYKRGNGVPQDYVRGYLWLDFAAPYCPPTERVEVRKTLETVEGKMTPEDLTEAKRLTNEWDQAHPREPWSAA